MPNIYPIQENFLGGVLSPKATGQVTETRYATALSECDNWVPTFQGSIKRRAGSRYVATLTATETRLFAFPIPSLEDDAVAVVTDTTVDIYDRTGPVIDAAQLFINKSFNSGLFGWTTDDESGWRAAFNITSGLSACGLVNDGAADRYIYQQVTTADPTLAHRLRAVVRFEYLLTIPSAASVTINIGTTARGTEIGQVVIDLTGLELQNTFIDEVFTPGVGNEDFFISFEFSVTGADANFYLAETACYDSTSVAPVGFASPWTKEQLSQIQVATDAASGQMFLVHPNVAPQLLTRTTSGSWSFAPVNFTVNVDPVAPPAEWTGTNWPSVVAIFQSRLWLAATPDEPSRIWASKTGDYLNFTTGTNDDDALDFSLTAQGAIEWIIDHKILAVGVSAGEWIGFGLQGVITPGDFQFLRQSAYGVASSMADFAGTHVVYITNSRQKVRSLYDDGDNSNGWKSDDISYFADNLFNQRIIEVAYAQEPNYHLWCLLGDGTVARCTFNADEGDGIAAWHTHSTDGFIDAIEDVSSIEGDSMFITVKRDNGVFLEYITAEEELEYYSDSHSLKNVETTANFTGAFDWSYSDAFDGGLDGVIRGLSGLDHLEGQTVCVTAFEYDAVTQTLAPRQHCDEVVTGGSIELEPWAEGVAAAGLKYLSRAVTLPKEGGNQAGTAQGDKRKWNRIFGRFVQSAPPLMNGYYPEGFDATAWGTKTDAILNGDYDLRNEGFDDGVVVLEQDSCLRTELAGIFGKSQSNAT